VPQGDFTPAGMMPRLKQFKVTGIFSVGYQYDRRYALMNIQDEATLLKMQGKVSNLQLKLDDLYNAPKVADKLNAELPVGYKAYDWTDSNSNFFKALKMEKTMMFLILALIVAVAAFNMLSTLVMVVTDKRSDIAILRTIGAGTKHIMGLFMVQGLAIGFIGTLAGVLSGVILALNTTAIVNWIQNIFNVKFLSAQVYYIDFLPSSLALSDVVTVALMALSMSFLATLYPAWKATRIDPAEVLRYE
jgi:lipoprotein-releasing system permease protein